jgi:CcmD family protein
MIPTRLRRVVGMLLVTLLVGGASAGLAGQQPVMDPDDPFVPITELPPQDQLPAAPLLVTAYSFVLLALFAYLFSVARRLQHVQREVERLEADVKRTE